MASGMVRTADRVNVAAGSPSDVGLAPAELFGARDAPVIFAGPHGCGRVEPPGDARRERPRHAATAD